MTTRANIKITVLQVLDRLPAGYPQRVAIQELEALRMITSTTCILTGERKYAITDAGRVQLSQI